MEQKLVCETRVHRRSLSLTTKSGWSRFLRDQWMMMMVGIGEISLTITEILVEPLFFFWREI